MKTVGTISVLALAALTLPAQSQRPVKNKFLDEIRSLKKGKLLLCRLGEVLIEVTQKARIPLRIGEIIDQCPGIGIRLAPEIEKLLRRIARRRRLPERVVLPE